MDWTTSQIVWGIGTAVVTVGFVWWWIAKIAAASKEKAMQEEREARIAEEARETSRQNRHGPNVRTALNRSRRGGVDFEEDEGLDIEDIVDIAADVVEAGAIIADMMDDREEQVQEPVTEREPYRAPDPATYEQAPAYRAPDPAPEPDRSSSYSSSDSGGSSYDSGSSDSGGGGGGDD